MYIVEFIFFGGSRLFRETLTSVDEVEQFLRGFDELEKNLFISISSGKLHHERSRVYKR